jgi:uncharacterized protein YneF (UPF0154 family)
MLFVIVCIVGGVFIANATLLRTSFSYRRWHCRKARAWQLKTNPPYQLPEDM